LEQTENSTLSNSLYSHQYDGTVIHKSCLQCLQNRRKQNRTLKEITQCELLRSKNFLMNLKRDKKLTPGLLPAIVFQLQKNVNNFTNIILKVAT